MPEIARFHLFSLLSLCERRMNDETLKYILLPCVLTLTSFLYSQP